MSDRATSSAERVFSFGPFCFLPAQLVLLEGDKPVRLGSRALGVLAVLVEHAGELVSKDMLVSRVWPNTIVEDVSLRVHIAALRKALRDGQDGHRYLATIAGRGYCFVTPVTIAEPSAASGAQTEALRHGRDLPLPLTRMIGRADVVKALADQLPNQRFLTIAGPGGIGKTTVALAVADALKMGYANGVCFIDLSPLTDPRLVSGTVASRLGLSLPLDDPLSALASHLQNRRLLLIFDNCEHVVAAAADAAEVILRTAPGVHILTTSREPLRAEGERVQRLPALAVPPETRGLSAAEALSFPAVQLFVERVAASLDGFTLTDADAPCVSEICRKLDGIALAIELAAGRVEAFGVQGLLALLGDCLPVLTSGRRMASPRHRTLAATLTWSHDLLPMAERIILRRLAVFVSSFTLDCACTVAVCPGLAAVDIVNGIANLVAKSLIAAETRGSVVHYRLFDTTRAYARAKLIESGEAAQVSRRHAEHMRDRLDRSFPREAGIRPHMRPGLPSRPKADQSPP